MKNIILAAASLLIFTEGANAEHQYRCLEADTIFHLFYKSKGDKDKFIAEMSEARWGEPVLTPTIDDKKAWKKLYKAVEKHKGKNNPFQGPTEGVDKTGTYTCTYTVHHGKKTLSLVLADLHDQYGKTPESESRRK